MNWNMNFNSASRLYEAMAAGRAFYTRRLIGLVVIFLLLSAALPAQNLTREQRYLEQQRPLQLQEPFYLLTVPPVEGSIDPDQYAVGPSDVFGVNIWINPPLNFVLQVTPEGTLLIPTVGEVKVSDMPLSAAKRAVLREITSKYSTGDPTVTLLAPRRIVVRVRGQVRNQGTHVQYATDRVESAIQQANEKQREQLRESLYPVEKFMSTRNIVLRRRDGSLQRVDLPQFYATRDDRWNPFLREGDEIIVPRFDETRDVIGVYGGVNAPGRFEYAPGDSLLTAIALASGFSPRAMQDSVVLSRLDSSGMVMERHQINIQGIEEGKEPNIALRPGDRVFVKESSDLRGDYRVWVTGEVLYPGMYPITRQSTRLSEIIARAGGVTPHASLTASQLFRKSVSPEEARFEYLKSYRGIVAPDDSLNYLIEAILRIRREFVQVDFEEALARTGATGDVVLQSEDSIYVAPRKGTVYVFGQVLSPGHVTHVQDKDVDYYLERAGGTTDRAKESGVLVIKRASGQALGADEAKVEDGDYVWVPLSPDRPDVYYFTLAAQAAAVITAASSLVLVIISLNQ